jgi:hypothetical protein
MKTAFRSDPVGVKLALALREANHAAARATVTDRRAALARRDAAQRRFDAYLGRSHQSAAPPVLTTKGRAIMRGVDCGLTTEIIRGGRGGP